MVIRLCPWMPSITLPSGSKLLMFVARCHGTVTALSTQRLGERHCPVHLQGPNLSYVPFSTAFPWRLWGRFLPSCTSGAILGFSILLKDTSTCSSVPPRGAGTQTSNLLITSPPALPTELHPPYLILSYLILSYLQRLVAAVYNSDSDSKYTCLCIFCI